MPVYDGASMMTYPTRYHEAILEEFPEDEDIEAIPFLTCTYWQESASCLNAVEAANPTISNRDLFGVRRTPFEIPLGIRLCRSPGGF